MKASEKCLDSLDYILNKRSELKQALGVSIEKANDTAVKTVKDYFIFLQSLLTEIPIQRTMSSLATRFHHLISLSPENILKKDPVFLNWLVEFSKCHGAYLNSTESAGALNAFLEDPAYKIDDYDPGPSGWLTFNQFFARHVKPGRRPIDGLYNDSIVVAATDSVFRGSWPVDDHAAIEAKGTQYLITQLLQDSPYRDEFAGGFFTHSYLDTNDYHRFHVPVAGRVKDVRKIPGNVIVNTVVQDDGTPATIDGVGFQMTQTRGLIVIESAIGLVAVLPIGMGHVSSVNITAEIGVFLAKGQEFGYFAYGGSDMVMLFQKNRVEFTAIIDTHYKQGQQIAAGTLAD